MKTKITFFKMMLFIFAITASITLQAQTPVVHMQFENNLTNTGSSSLTFALGGANSTGVSVPYSSNSAEGSNALDFGQIDNETVNINLIQNGAASHDCQISSTTSSGITGSDARSISAWVRYADKNDSTNGSHTIVNMGDPTSPSLGRTTFTFAAANNQIQLGVSGGNVKHFYNNGEGLEQDLDWHHVAFTYPAAGTLADVIYYVDGVAVTDNDAGASSTKVLETTADKIYIGSNGNNGTKWFDGGGIDDLRIYDVELTATQMLAVYNENVLSTASIENISSSIYPNPVNSTLNINSDINTKTYKVINMLGATVKNVSATGTLDVSDLPAGIYVLITDAGIAKFIKQ